MPDATFIFEAEPFELPAEGFEAEFSRGSRRPPTVPMRRPPVRPFRARRRIPRVLVPPIVQAAESRCPTAAVLEGYARGSAALEPHHEPMLKRIADFLQRSRAEFRSVQVIAWSSAADPRGTAAQRLESASGRLQELLKAGNRPVPVQGSVHSTRGPERVEIRLCM